MAARMVEYLAEHQPTLAPEFWPMLHRAAYKFQSRPFTDAVLETYGVPELPIAVRGAPMDDDDDDNVGCAAEPTTPKEMVIDDDDDDAPDPMVWPKRAIEPDDVGSIFKTETLCDGGTETSWLMLKKFDADAGLHTIQWFYTPEQLEPFDLGADHYNVTDPVGQLSKEEEIEGAGAVVLYLSDHTQRLEPDDWVDVTGETLWMWPAEPAPDIIYVIGRVSLEGPAPNGNTDGSEWFVDALLTMGRDGGAKIKDRLKTSEVWVPSVMLPAKDGRCWACGLKKPLSMRFRLLDTRPHRSITVDVGSTCGAKMDAAYRLHKNTHACLTAGLLDKARSALAM